MDLLTDDEGRTNGSETAIVRRSKPEFLTIGEGRQQRQLCSTGRADGGLDGDADRGTGVVTADQSAAA
jgi:hypothetical protein